MTRARFVSSLVIGVALAIGCGSTKPQDAGAAPQPAAPSEAPKAAASSAGGSATIQGVIRFSGTAPAPEKVQMAADPICQQKHSGAPQLSEEVVVNSNQTLKNVFVYVKEGLQGSFPPPAQPAVIDQNGCWYVPRVLGAQVGQPLEIRNSDQTLHNVNAKPVQNQPFNVAQPVPMKTEKKFTKPEIMVPLKCNVHPWMHAYVGVVAHPFFAVSDASGAFAISGLPAGTYTLEAWHEKYGTQTRSVTVTDSQTQSVEFAYQAQ